MHYQNVIKYLRPVTSYAAAALAATIFIKGDINIGSDIRIPPVIEAEAMHVPDIDQEEIEQVEVHEELVEQTEIIPKTVEEEVEENEVEIIEEVVEEIVEEPIEYAVETIAVPTEKRNWSNEEIHSLIQQGYFTEEDFVYMTAVGGECFNDYEGFYAVASCVMNRIKSGRYPNVKSAVTATGQFLGYNCPVENASAYSNFCTQEVRDAAVNVLLGGESNIGDAYFFRGRVSDKDMWADPNISEFYVWGGNVFYTYADASKKTVVHNDKGETSPDYGILIYDDSNNQWQFQSGDHYVGGSYAE